jgi:malonyl-CoA decarboxylase
LKRISWDSPAALLEKLIAYEAVHEIQSWNDLKNRLEADRRCFAFFHPRMPDEPLIFVEVALVAGMAGNIHALLDESAPLGDPNAADTAIFYSISNCQRGLNGISFGDFLIKRVVDALAAELPRLKVFATLSPVPGFRAWLSKEGPRLELQPAEAKALSTVVVNGAAAPDLVELLDRPGWQTDPALTAALREPLVRLCAQYLLQEKGRSGRAADPVAHFHLTNGARVQRLNWLGDLSEKGLQQSAGIMVNYLYRLDHIETNHEAYRGEGKVAASSTVRHLLRNR